MAEKDRINGVVEQEKKNGEDYLRGYLCLINHVSFGSNHLLACSRCSSSDVHISGMCALIQNLNRSFGPSASGLYMRTICTASCSKKSPENVEASCLRAPVSTSATATSVGLRHIRSAPDESYTVQVSFDILDCPMCCGCTTRSRL